MTMYSYCASCGARNDQSHYSNCTANDPPAAPEGTLIWCVSRIREITGAGGKPMLSELPGVIGDILQARIDEIERLRDALKGIAECAMSGSMFEELALAALTPTPPSVASRVPSTNQEP